VADYDKRIKDLVSVVISTYNYQNYILETLDSLAKQTYPEIELIIIDDCSTDDTTIILENWYRQHKGIFKDYIYIKLPRNCYSSWALNIGFLVSKGEFIVIHDADDISHESKIEKQVQWLKTHPETAVLGTSFWALERGLYYKPFWLSYQRQEITLNYKVNNKHCVSFGTLMFRAEILNNISGVKKHPDNMNDFIFLKDIVNHGYIVDNLEEGLIYIRLHPGQLSEKYLKNFTEFIPVEEGSFKKIKKRVSIVISIEDLSGMILKVLNNIAYQLYPDIEIIIVDNLPFSGNTKKLVLDWYSNYQAQSGEVIKELIYFQFPVQVPVCQVYNIGSYLAKGEYIFYQSDTEFIEKNRIQKLHSYLEENSAYSAAFVVKKGEGINNFMLKSSVIDQTAGFGRTEKELYGLSFVNALAKNGYYYRVLDE